ncbi:hypothetical protein I551_5809 [Mycobacterium ulcerans str. Harvey]|uniref:Uncharacterized protein n=1 Tax=Mycobacterium ulcerans str. Harvey TaxID=1299332 RepID=A0ABN0QST4_MYCUL|nr:hypothetical protein I551_5809 [Mycobacterium ulcerans str. Harvey]
MPARSVAADPMAALGAPAPVGQVVSERKPAALCPCIAKLLQQ